MWTIDALNNEIATGRTSCEEVVGAALARASSTAGEGGNAFRSVRKGAALKESAAQDVLRATRMSMSPLAGLPISIKDNIDFAGEPTRGGCKLLDGAPPARKHATAVERLLAAGAVIIGRTNMSELAFSGIGYNRFTGTPANPFERDVRRIPGGSSSGAAVSVTDRMAIAAIGTDTGGSVRIPAALTGIVGFKPTQARIPRDGVLPLSTLLDCIGPLAQTVADCALLDSVLAADPAPLERFMGRLRLCTADDFMLADADDAVRTVYQSAKTILLRSGAEITGLPNGSFWEMDAYGNHGSFSSAEAWERFGALVEVRPHDIDARIAERIVRGRTISAADWIQNLRARAAMIARFEAQMQNFDALIAPATPIIAPPIADMEDDDKFRCANVLILRNPMVANLLDAPSLSLPCHQPGTAPVGLMLIGPRLSDRRLLSIGVTIERVVGDMDRLR